MTDADAALECRIETIMTRDVRTVRTSTPIEEAARQLLEHHISGMPVLDREGTVVGVVTLTDIAKRLRGEGADASDGTVFYGGDELAALLESLVEGRPIRGIVEDVMSKKVIAVPAQTTVRDAGRRMVAERIHRVLVTDSAGGLLGIVSTLDVVAHVSK